VGSIDVIGVPSSMGAFAPGQERAPAALRDAELIARLEDAGLEVRDHGDAELLRWFPDREHPFAQHVAAVRDVALETADRVTSVDGDLALVLGGDCTIELGTLAGLQRRLGGSVGLVYFDLHADMNTPTTVRWGRSTRWAWPTPSATTSPSRPWRRRSLAARCFDPGSSGYSATATAAVRTTSASGSRRSASAVRRSRTWPRIPLQRPVVRSTRSRVASTISPCTSTST
jgi:hypothetical protein